MSNDHNHQNMFIRTRIVNIVIRYLIIIIVSDMPIQLLVVIKCLVSITAIDSTQSTNLICIPS